MGKFYSKYNGGIFLSYSSGSKDYRCSNKILCNIVESANLNVDEARPQKEKWHTYEHPEEMSCKEEEKGIKH